jgi:hypothetical protein
VQSTEIENLLRMVYVPLLLTALDELKSWITETCAKIDHDILYKVWQEVRYQFHIAQATSGAHTLWVDLSGGLCFLILP